MNRFSILLLVAGLLCFSTPLLAQGDKARRPSPPAKASATIDDLQILIDYSRPSVKGRTIWGMLVPYGKVWRTGANEATTFQINKDVMVEGQPLPAGKYALFSIPGEEKWTLIFNKKPDQWGAYNYDPEADALRVEIKPKPSEDFVEYLTFTIVENEEESRQILLRWEEIQIDWEVKAAE